MSDTRYIKAGDRWPALKYDVRYDDRRLDITGDVDGSTTVTFTIKRIATGEVVVNDVGGTITEQQGYVTVSLDWPVGSTNVPGEYAVTMEITVGGRRGTAPGRGYKLLVIEP